MWAILGENVSILPSRLADPSRGRQIRDFPAASSPRRPTGDDIASLAPSASHWRWQIVGAQAGSGTAVNFTARFGVRGYQKNAVAMPNAMSTTAPIMTSCSSLTSSAGRRDMALDGSTLDGHPQKTAPLTAPVLDTPRNGKLLQLHFAHSDRPMAARALRNR